ncbi:MAG: HAMP domain-containing sensor histidine kinase [Bacteroidia bacterium]|nr:HAMP domain-containing sensor histidine kinase [Bacteroidia bacterium]
MNPHLKQILEWIEKQENLEPEERQELEKSLKAVDKELTIANFKLQRTERVKRTTAILLEETIHELDEKRKAVEEANKAKSVFLSTVNHELRTPLTSIIGFAKINQKRIEKRLLPFLTEDPKRHNILRKILKNNEVIISEGGRLTSLINELLDLAKIESGKMDWNMDEFQPSDLIERATNATSSLFIQKPSLKLIKEIPHDLPQITGDQNRLLQVLINLISNAVKFTDAGQVRLRVTLPSSSEGQGKNIRFQLTDTGSGIPANQLDKVFERFKQVEDNQTGKPKGTGLGLPICKQIVEHHKGRIWVESEIGKGSSFFFSIPFS